MSEGKRSWPKVERVKRLMTYKLTHYFLYITGTLTTPFFFRIIVRFYFRRLIILCNKKNSRVFERGSRGPSTVTLIALDKVATCGGDVCSNIVSEKLLPGNKKIRIF